jgi:hypothetical protein
MCYHRKKGYEWEAEHSIYNSNRVFRDDILEKCDYCSKWVDKKEPVDLTEYI